jgi:hypothetical protein
VSERQAERALAELRRLVPEGSNDAIAAALATLADRGDAAALRAGWLADDWLGLYDKNRMWLQWAVIVASCGERGAEAACLSQEQEERLGKDRGLHPDLLRPDSCYLLKAAVIVALGGDQVASLSDAVVGRTPARRRYSSPRSTS